MATGEGVRLTGFPAATGFSDTDLVFMTQAGATVKGTLAQLRTALSNNRSVETFVAGTNFTPGSTASLMLANTYGSINNIDVYFDGVPQLDCTLSGKTLTFNPTIPAGISQVVVKGGAANGIGIPADGSVTDTKVAAGSKSDVRNNFLYLLSDYGPTPSSSTLASAVSAIQTAGGGVLKMGRRSDITLPATYPGVVLQYEGAAIPFSQYGETPSNIATAYKVLRSFDAGSHVGTTRSVMAVEHHVVGSGLNGPANSDIGLTVSVMKQPGGITATPGEIDGIVINLRQGGSVNSDCAGILANVVNSAIAGFTAFSESNVYVLDHSGNYANGINVQISPQGYDGGTGIYNGYGFAAHATVGVQTAAFLASAGSSAFGTGRFSSLMQYAANGYLTFDMPITAGGVVWMKLMGADHVSKYLRADAGAFQVLNDAQNTALLSLDDSGNFSVANTATFGAVKMGTLTQAGVFSTTATSGGIAPPAQVAGYMTWTNGATVIKVPYYNS